MFVPNGYPRSYAFWHVLTNILRKKLEEANVNDGK
jgi:hypothetical protein